MKTKEKKVITQNIQSGKQQKQNETGIFLAKLPDMERRIWYHLT